MRLKTLLCCLLGALSAGAAIAQIYTWKDSSGRTHFSDQPPPDTPAKTMRGGVAVEPAAPPAAGASVPGTKSSAPKSWEEQDKDFRQRQAERAEAEAKAGKDKEERKRKDQYCSSLRNNIAMLERGGRVARPDANGEPVFMNENQVSGEVSRLRAQLAKDCS